jgi:hypothetical protein
MSANHGLSPDPSEHGHWRPRPLLVEIAPGELIDKITILEIKEANVEDAEKVRNIRRELLSLTQVREQCLPDSDKLRVLFAELKTVNLTLWNIEDEIRVCERQGDFGARFVELARAVYVTNDQRASIKRQINMLLNSQIVEEKSYEAY